MDKCNFKCTLNCQSNICIGIDCDAFGVCDYCSDIKCKKENNYNDCREGNDTQENMQ